MNATTKAKKAIENFSPSISQEMEKNISTIEKLLNATSFKPRTAKFIADWRKDPDAVKYGWAQVAMLYLGQRKDYTRIAKMMEQVDGYLRKESKKRMKKEFGFFF